jgi:hypothetical protein
MAKKVFFSFHYQDVKEFRANVVRRHWQMKPDRESAGFFDSSLWEEARQTGALAIKRLVNSGLNGTTVTCVLIGTQTYSRPWVRYELLKSFKRGNQLLAVHINSIKGIDQKTKALGKNPLEYVGVTFSESGITATLWEKLGNEWHEYDEIDGGSSYRLGTPAPERLRGKGFNLGRFYPTYDWVTDDGYENFSSWIDA